MHRLFVLGRVDLTDPSGTGLGAVLAQPRRVALLAFLAANRGGASRRDQLLGMFWPEVDESRARKALNKSLHFLRQALGDDAVISRGAEDVEVNPARIWCDASAFSTAVEAGDAAEALQLYRGDLLPAFYIDEAPAFESWVESERSRLRRLASRVSISLAQQREREGQLTTAIALARQAVEMSEDDERSFRELLEMLDRLGDRAGALYAYDKFARRLADDLGAEPAPETRALIERVRGRRDAPSEAARSQLRQPNPPASTPTESVGNLVHAREHTIATRRTLSRSLLGLAVVAGVAMLASLHGSAPVATQQGETSDVPARARVVVAPFINEAGDTASGDLGKVIAGWIQDAIAQTGVVEVTDFRSLTVRGPGSAAPAVAPHDTRALAEAAGASLVVHGSVSTLGDSIEIRARLMDASAGTVRASIAPVRAAAAAPMDGVDQVAQRAAGALATLTNAQAKLALTASLHVPTYAAYREFNAGMALYQTDIAASVDHFREAIALDSLFFAPKVWLASAFHNLTGAALMPSRDSVIAIIEALHRRRAEGSDLDRAVLDYLRALPKGEFEKQIAAMRKAAATWPDRYTTNLANALVHDGRPREAIATLRTVDPTRGFLRGWGGVYWLIYVYAYLLLGDFDGALEVARRAQEQFPARANVQCFEGMALIGRGEVAKADSLMNARMPGARGATGVWDEATCWRRLARTAAYFLPPPQQRPILESALRFFELDMRDPSVARSHAAAAAEIAMWMGDTARFVAYHDSVSAPRVPTRASLLRRAYARALAHDRPGAHRFRSASLALPLDPYERGLTEHWLARIELALGDAGAAARYASEAHAKGASVDGVHLDPALRQLRGHPVFEALVER